MPKTEATQARRLAFGWLARREHSRRELYNKLLGKGIGAPLAARVIEELERGHWLSEERFVESLLTARRRRGYGPLRIRQELQDRGIPPEEIERWVDPAARDWLEDLKQVRRRKFGDRPPRSYAERARQARFLQYRGFTLEHIRRVLHSPEGD